MFSFFKSQVNQVLMRCNVIDLFEHSQKVLTVHHGQGRYIFQRNALITIPFSCYQQPYA